MSHPTAACVRGSSRDSALPVNGPLGARFNGKAEPRAHSRPLPQTLALLAFLSVSPTVRLSALQCADGSPPPCRATPHTPRFPPPYSVAVQYFDNLSADTAAAYLSDGLAEALIVRLGRVDRLVVASRTAVQRFRGRPEEDARVRGRTLNVAHLVTGSVRQAGGRIRVTAELVRARDGRRMWGEQYERPAREVVELEEDVATAVAIAVVGRLLPAERAALATAPTRESRAYDHYLRGNHVIAERSPASVAQAIAEYEAAVRLDPRFTEALARLSWAYGIFYEHGWVYEGLTQQEVLALASSAADRAVAQDSANSEAWHARAEMLSYAYPQTLDSAIRAYQRALTLNQRNAQAMHDYALMLQWVGDDSGAIAGYHRTLALEPDRPVTLTNLARISYAQRRYGEALRWLDSALTLDPGFLFAHSLRARVHLSLGDLESARRDAETAARHGLGVPTEVYSTQALLSARMGDTAVARRWAEQLLTEVRDREHPTSEEGLGMGVALVALGDTAEALSFLDRVRPRDGLLSFQLRLPEFDPVRSSARFRRLVQESRPQATIR